MLVRSTGLAARGAVVSPAAAAFGNGVLTGMDFLEQPVGLGEMPSIEFGLARCFRAA
jgi:hypothetical protein